MVEPIVLPRSEHTLYSRDVDPDALKVMSRLQELGHTAFLVGGSVRDLLLGRRPKDFDIGTSAQPHQIKRGFRNCWIIGRRFRLAHVKFGTKTIEVATFRQDAEYLDGRHPSGVTFSDPRHDAQRRDFTINGMFYDPLAEPSEAIHDYVGGQIDLAARVIRAIGDPAQRFHEDKLRMLRAVRFTAAYDFRLDLATAEAILAGSRAN